jgi:hypothetical protein
MDEATRELWRQLAVNLTRCEHGRVQGDACYGCPDGRSPDQSGRELGWSLDGAYRVVVPPRAMMSDPRAWLIASGGEATH